VIAKMISIIIPVYNEENVIRKILGSLSYSDNAEVIVVDGKSSDRTVEFAKQYPVKIIQCIKNRAFQMNEGARVAGGEIFLFLHADCVLEDGSLEKIEHSLSGGYVGGCLKQKINSNRIIYRYIEASGNIRARLFKIFYGDQAIFVRRNIFFKIGGFDDVDLFDDVIFSKKLKKMGKICVLDSKVYTSPRRWEKQGIIKTTLINWLLSLGYLLRISPNILKIIYHDVR
jgi:rSAM/selenodomain-associated transferase 2